MYISSIRGVSFELASCLYVSRLDDCGYGHATQSVIDSFPLVWLRGSARTFPHWMEASVLLFGSLNSSIRCRLPRFEPPEPPVSSLW
jgi:hypothetical protein